LQNIDTTWWNANLEDASWRIVEVRRRHSSERCAEVRESSEDGFTVDWVGLDQNIEVFGTAGFGMDAYCMGPYDEIFHAMCVQGSE
jgi:hypothetical protein